MKNKIGVISFFAVLLLIAGCGQKSVQEKELITGAVISSDVLEEDLKEEIVIVEKTAEKEMEPEIKELLEKGKTVRSISYQHKGPETGNFYYDFYVKGDNVRYIPNREIKSVDDKDSYNSIYLDKAEETAEAHCDDRQCVYKGKKADLRYVDYNILTPFDWMDEVISAEKTGEELIGSRKTWKLKANEGTELWVDVYFGVPLQVMRDGEKYEFIKMVFNRLEDSDVVSNQE
ncbi:hypothetical protein ISS05_01880 [Candidatus Woesearchaeota archaeon]|nr:hypothetical protein [Candidatus Woesearchaeota archaeon]